MTDLQELLENDADFQAVYNVWDGARQGALTPHYQNIHLEQLNRSVASLTIFDHYSRDDQRWSFVGSGTQQFLDADLQGRNLYELVHANSLEMVKDFYEGIASSPAVGFIKYSANLNNGLVSVRNGFAVPCQTSEAGLTKIIVLSKDESSTGYKETDQPVIYGESPPEISLFTIR